MTKSSTGPCCNANSHVARRRRAMGSLECQVISLVAAVLLSLCLAGLQVAAASQDGHPGKAPAGNPENGKKLYNSNTCDGCHGLSGEGGGAGPRIAPDPIPFPQFLAQLRHPADAMPAYDDQTITDAQLGDIYAFLKAPEETPKDQAAAFSSAGENGRDRLPEGQH